MMPGQSLALRGPSLSPCHRVCRQARRRCDKWWAAAMAPMRSQLRAMAQALRWSRFSAASSGEAPPSTLSSGRALRRGLSSLQGNFVAARSATRRFRMSSRSGRGALCAGARATCASSLARAAKNQVRKCPPMPTPCAHHAHTVCAARACFGVCSRMPVCISLRS